MEGYRFLLLMSATFSGINVLATAPDMKRLTQGCGTTKTCFLPEKNCMENNNCTIGMAVARNDFFYFEFELQTTRGVYVAVGLSFDDKMGNDSVVHCSKSENNVVSLYVSWNAGYVNRVAASNSKDTGMELINSFYREGSLYCKFRRFMYIVVEQDFHFYLSNTEFHVLLAAGTSVQANGSMSYHDIVRVASTEARFLQDIGMFSINSSSYLQNSSFFLLVQLAFTAYSITASSI